MKIKQVMARMLVEMKPEVRTDEAKAEAKADTNLKQIRAYQEILKEEILARMEAKMDSHHEKLMTTMKACKEKVETMRQRSLSKGTYRVGVSSFT
jgi:hypothetical protein